MTPEERSSMMYLCEKIATEKDPQKFNKLVLELNELLEKSERRLAERKSAEGGSQVR